MQRPRIHTASPGRKLNESSAHTGSRAPARKPRAPSVEQLACAADISASTLEHSRWELSDPHLSTVLKLCRALGVTAGELLNELTLPVEPRPSYTWAPAQAGVDA
jgi:DNA-binding Xre family transcriptional regulator